jgi:hypothetical protein
MTRPLNGSHLTPDKASGLDHTSQFTSEDKNSFEPAL